MILARTCSFPLPTSHCRHARRQGVSGESLKAFADKYHPPFSAVLSGRNLGADPHFGKHYYPLYLASKFPLPPCAERSM